MREKKSKRKIWNLVRSSHCELNVIENKLFAIDTPTFCATVRQKNVFDCEQERLHKIYYTDLIHIIISVVGILVFIYSLLFAFCLRMFVERLRQMTSYSKWNRSTENLWNSSHWLDDNKNLRFAQKRKPQQQQHFCCLHFSGDACHIFAAS